MPSSSIADTPSPFPLWHVLCPNLKFSTIIQHVTDLVPRASLPNLPHHSIESIKHTELEQQANESPLEIKQQCLVSIDTHIYEDKFCCEVVTRNMDHIEGVTIYGRSVSENLRDAVWENLTFCTLSTFSPLRLNKRVFLLRLYLLKYLVIINKVTSNYYIRLCRCGVPIPRVWRRYCDVYTQVKNTLMYIR